MQETTPETVIALTPNTPDWLRPILLGVQNEIAGEVTVGELTEADAEEAMKLLEGSTGDSGTDDGEEVAPLIAAVGLVLARQAAITGAKQAAGFIAKAGVAGAAAAGGEDVYNYVKDNIRRI